MGNDDLKSNKSFLKQKEKETKSFFLIDKRVFKDKEISFIGYNYVPITPFIYKDWEKQDLDSKKENNYRKNIVLKGIITKKYNTINYDFKKSKRSTIEHDMTVLFKKSGKKTSMINKQVNRCLYWQFKCPKLLFAS